MKIYCYLLFHNQQNYDMNNLHYIFGICVAYSNVLLLLFNFNLFLMLDLFIDNIFLTVFSIAGCPKW